MPEWLHNLLDVVAVLTLASVGVVFAAGLASGLYARVQRARRRREVEVIEDDEVW